MSSPFPVYNYENCGIEKIACENNIEPSQHSMKVKNLVQLIVNNTMITDERKQIIYP